MKKLFVLPALALGLLVGTQNVLANETSTSNMIVKVEQDKYIDLAVENLPQAVLDAIVRDFKGATISAAAATKDASEFKLELSQEDGESVEVYYDADGNLIKKGDE